jgi:hypothetical protein
LTTHKIVAADHIRAKQAKQLMPDCKTVAVTGDPEIALRLFWAKWTQLPAPKWHRWHAQHPNVPIIDLEIAEYENCPIEAVTDDMRARDWQYNLQRTEQFHQHHRTDDSDYRLDFLTLFQPTTSKTVYHDMMDALGLEPNWPAVNSFIETYMAAQPRHLI